MSNPALPAELLDHIADHLDTACALRNCCLVSKSWIPRTRKHLFAKIKFVTAQKLHSWKRTFPDPSTSPACYTKTLLIGCLRAVTAADAEAGGWIGGFSRVVHLEVNGHSVATTESTVSLAPFHGFSPAIKSLYVSFAILPCSWVFSLVLSFPLLEDLTLIAYDIDASTDNGDDPDGPPTTIQSSKPPAFTGSLHLFLSRGGMSFITHQLLSLPGGIHFRKLDLTWFHEEDSSLTMALVEKCYRTVETLDITCNLGMSIRHDRPHRLLTSIVCLVGRSAPIDLSKATRLKNAVFRLKSMDVEWITTAFQTTIPKHPELQQISIHVPYDLTTFDVKRSTVHGQWLDLDLLLVQFCELRSTHPKLTCRALIGETRDMREFVKDLLPELTRRGMIDLVVRYV